MTKQIAEERKLSKERERQIEAKYGVAAVNQPLPKVKATFLAELKGILLSPCFANLRCCADSLKNWAKKDPSQDLASRPKAALLITMLSCPV